MRARLPCNCAALCDSDLALWRRISAVNSFASIANLCGPAGRASLEGHNYRLAVPFTIGSNYSFLFSPTSAGRAVNERTAMQMTAVYSCVRILAETIAGLPLHVYQTRSDGGKEKAVSHPLYRLLHDEPNPEMTSFVFRETGPVRKLLTVCLCGCCPGRLV